VPVELYEVRPATPPSTTAKHVDAVCRMELTPEKVAARATIERPEHVFCPAACLQQFVTATERYTAP
jgi:YHS domain-containing protein